MSKTQYKISSVEVGLWKLPGVLLDTDQISEADRKLLEASAIEQGATILKPDLFSWRSVYHRDWFLLKHV